MPLGEMTTWQQEMGGGGRRPRLATLLLVMVAVVAAVVLVVAPALRSDPDGSTGGRVGPACVELARLERHHVTNGPAFQRAQTGCRREQRSAPTSTGGRFR